MAAHGGAEAPRDYLSYPRHRCFTNLCENKVAVAPVSNRAANRKRTVPLMARPTGGRVSRVATASNVLARFPGAPSFAPGSHQRNALDARNCSKRCERGLYFCRDARCES